MQAIKPKEILFIINPNSGGKNGNKIVSEIKAIDPSISCKTTHSLEDLEEVFRLNIEKYKVFIAVGGDGTVNQTIAYLCNRNDKIFGVLPMGSGNGFSRELDFGNSIKSLIESALKGDSVNIDLLSINGHKCVNAAGIGFDSFIAHKFQHSKNRGLISYIYHTFKSIFVFKPFHATITFNKQSLENKYHTIVIANTRQYGNNALIAPQADPSDGIFELVLIKPLPLYIYPFFAFKLFLGTLKNSKYIEYISLTDTVEIKSSFNKYHIDGEPKMITDKLSINMLHDKVRVLRCKC